MCGLEEEFVVSRLATMVGTPARLYTDLHNATVGVDDSTVVNLATAEATSALTVACSRNTPEGTGDLQMHVVASASPGTRYFADDLVVGTGRTSESGSK